MIAWRDATANDADALAAMAIRVWTETFAHACSPENLAAYLADAYGPDGALRRHLPDPAYRFRLAIADGAIVGYAKLAPSAFDAAIAGPAAVKLDQLYVLRGWQGAGVAAALMDWAEETARGSGAAALLLTVWEENERARRFYARRGFVHVGDHAFPVGDQVDRDLVMRLAL